MRERRRHPGRGMVGEGQHRGQVVYASRSLLSTVFCPRTVKGPGLCVYVNPQGLQGSHLNLSQTSAHDDVFSSQ